MERTITDLEQVKSIAKTFLYLDIQTTKLSPIIVKHPFFDFGITAIHSETGLQVLNILESETDLRIARNEIKHKISKADAVLQISMLVTKPYKLVFLKYIQEHLSPEDIARYLKCNWSLIENISGDLNVSKSAIVKMFKAADKTILLSKSEQQALEAMGKTVEIYRGIKNGKHHEILGISWTTNIETARFFANRFNKGGCIYRAKIDLKDILAYFIDRLENEVVVNYRVLQDITKIEEIKPSGEVVIIGKDDI